MIDKRYNSTIDATTGCALRLVKDAIAEDDEGMTHGVHADAWFASAKQHRNLLFEGSSAFCKLNSTIHSSQKITLKML
jgi:hypothetical protein